MNIEQFLNREVLPDQIGSCCAGLLDAPRLPHIHAEDCPRRSEIEDGNGSSCFPDILFREDFTERRQWDSIGQRCGVTPLQQVADCLDGYGRAYPQQGSFAQTFFIMANDVAKADKALSLLLAERDELLAEVKALRAAAVQ